MNSASIQALQIGGDVSGRDREAKLKFAQGVIENMLAEFPIPTLAGVEDVHQRGHLLDREIAIPLIVALHQGKPAWAANTSQPENEAA